MFPPGEAMAPLLIVEDDRDIRETLDLLLTEEGYHTVVAASLSEALALVDERTFALILSDLFAHSPNRALDSVAALRDRAHPIPVGIITGWNLSPSDVADQGYAFLARKPFDVDDLATSIAAALRSPLGPDDERRAEVVRRYFASLTARDWDAVANLCADDVTYVLPGHSPFSATVQGRAAFRAFTEQTFSQFPGAQFQDVHIYPTPQGLAARYQGSWPVDDHGEQRMAGSVVFQFDGARIRQIGVRLNDERLRALVETAPQAGLG